MQTHAGCKQEDNSFNLPCVGILFHNVSSDMQIYEIVMIMSIDLIKIFKETMKRMSKNDIKMDDYRHVEMCDDYKLLMENGHKKEYVIAVLMEKYKLSESTIRRVINRLQQPVKM